MYKLYLALAFFYFTIFTSCDRKLQVFRDGTRFISIECEADNYSTVVNVCNVKAISRRVTTINLHLKNLRPCHKPIYVQMILYYRYGNIYREVIDTKRIEWCEIMDGLTGHLFLMQTITQIQQGAKDAIHKCPYEADIEVKNLTLEDAKRFDIFPEGTYKFSWLSSNKTSLLWRFNVTVQIKSPLKESMG